jgi:hypothetical protein
MIRSSHSVQVNQHIDLASGILRCPRCFGKDLVASHPRGLVDGIMRLFHKIPRHCRFCEKRFYVPEELDFSRRPKTNDINGGQ